MLVRFQPGLPIYIESLVGRFFVVFCWCCLVAFSFYAKIGVMKQGRDFVGEWLAKYGKQREAEQKMKDEFAKAFFSKYRGDYLADGKIRALAAEFAHDFARLCLMNAETLDAKIDWSYFYNFLEDSTYFLVLALHARYGENVSLATAVKLIANPDFGYDNPRFLSAETEVYWQHYFAQMKLIAAKQYWMTLEAIFEKYEIRDGSLMAWHDDMHGAWQKEAKRSRAIGHSMRTMLRNSEKAWRIAADFGEFLRRNGSDNTEFLQLMMRNVILLVLTGATSEKPGRALDLAICYDEPELVKEYLRVTPNRHVYNYWAFYMPRIVQNRPEMLRVFDVNFLASVRAGKGGMLHVSEMSVDDYGRLLREVLADVDPLD